MTKEKIDAREIEILLSEKLYSAREDAWLSACEWIISLKEDEKANCQKAFQDYIKSLNE